MSQKRCSKCGEIKERTAFYKDKRTKDGLQAYCRSCKLQAQRERGKGGVRKIMKQQKILAMAKGMAEGKTPGQAYMEISDCKSMRVAQDGAKNFLNKIETSDLDIFREYLCPPEILNSVKDFFTRVLTGQIPVTNKEYLETLAGWGKFAGTFAPDKIENIQKTTPDEVVHDTLEKVSQMLEAKDKEEK